MQSGLGKPLAKLSLWFSVNSNCQLKLKRGSHIESKPFIGGQVAALICSHLLNIEQALTNCQVD